MQEVLSGEQTQILFKWQISNWYKWRHPVTKLATKASGATWQANLQQMQVALSCDQIQNLFQWSHLLDKFSANKVNPVTDSIA